MEISFGVFVNFNCETNDVHNTVSTALTHYYIAQSIQHYTCILYSYRLLFACKNPLTVWPPASHRQPYTHLAALRELSSIRPPASGLTYPPPSYHYRSVKIYIDHVRIGMIWKKNDHDHRFLTLHNNMDFIFICFYLFLRKSC